jgi:hypothetical protein
VREKVKKFKLFEDNSTKFLTNDDVKDYFIELIDNGYEIQFFGRISHYNGKYFFTMRKEVSDESFGFVEDDNVYGFTDLDKIEEELNIFKILKESKDRLEAIGYKIAFEFEFNIAISTQFNITGHMKHSSSGEHD